MATFLHPQPAQVPLPSIRSVLGRPSASTSTPSTAVEPPSTLSVSLASLAAGRAAPAAEDEEAAALPLLMAMASIETKKEALEGQLLPRLDTLGTPPDAKAASILSSTSPIPLPSPPSPSPLSPELFALYSTPGGLVILSSSSSLSPPPSGSSSPALPSAAVQSAVVPSPMAEAERHYQSNPSAKKAYESATNSLMELSDIISSTPELQKLPVPVAPETDQCQRAIDIELDSTTFAQRALIEASSEPSPEVATESAIRVPRAADADPSSPVSSRTRANAFRRLQKHHQKRIRIERVQSEIDLERERSRELERELLFALHERDELLQHMSSNGSLTQLPADLAFLVARSTTLVDQPRSKSLPSFSSAFADITSARKKEKEGEGEEGAEHRETRFPVSRSKSAPVLPPIGSVPALSPYIKNKRSSLDAGLDVDISHRSSLPTSSSPVRSRRVSFCAGNSDIRPGLSRRRKSVWNEEEDDDYEPNSSAKKVKRTRSISEGGRGQPASGSLRRRSMQPGEGIATPFSPGHLGAHHVDNVGRQELPSVHLGGPEAAVLSKRDSVLSFIKEHPHASFWLRN